MKEIDTNNKQPLVSVIMPTYNHAKFIGEAIDSVLNQTYRNLELIIIDNFSEDNTERIVTSYKDDRIKYLKFRNNGVIAASRNYGIKHSHGEYIAFLDSDDMWVKCKLERQLSHFQSSEIVGVASDAILITNTPYYRKKNYGRSKLGYIDYQYIDILNGNPIMTSSCIIKRKIIENVGFFDENRDFCFIEDWELWLRMARFGSFRVLKEQLIFYLVSRKRGYQSSIISKNCLKIIKKQIDMNYVKYDDIREIKALIYLSTARNLLEFNQQQSRAYYIKALKTTSNIRRKIKSYVGILVSLLPPSLRTIVLLILYKADGLLFSIRKVSGRLAKGDHYV